MEREEMRDTEDVLFYAGYGFVIIVLGMMILLYSVGALDAGRAFGLWLLCTAFILIGLGAVRTESAPHGSRVLIGSGFFFAIISIAILGIILNVINPATAFAILILLLGLGILGLGIRRSRSTS
jgi:hypothetical protein